MNKELEALAAAAKPAIDHEMLNGKVEEAADFLELEEEVKVAIPQWLTMLLTSYPIAGLIIRFISKSGPQMAIQFNTFGDISDYWHEVSPGNRLSKLGYIAIADDPTTDQKAYFIHASEGDDPPVYMVKKVDFDDEADIMKYGAVVVADRLSEVFARQVLEE